MDIIFTALTYMIGMSELGLLTNAYELIMLPPLLWYCLHIKTGKTENPPH